ncbi:MAG: hypothetical protein H6710_02400 [Myxococcales bacterium]|nr:hypothetical protein [Myxococcales bacterium]MCB9703917.1 hypothetical protein [Myxococcales bacterium]
MPIALVDAAYGVSDRLVAAFTLGEAPTIDPLALVAIAWFILVGAGALWCARVDPWARRWLGPSALTLLILAIWRLGGSPAVFTAFALGVVGVIYLRDVDAG